MGEEVLGPKYDFSRDGKRREGTLLLLALANHWLMIPILSSSCQCIYNHVPLLSSLALGTSNHLFFSNGKYSDVSTNLKRGSIFHKAILYVNSGRGTRLSRHEHSEYTVYWAFGQIQ